MTKMTTLKFKTGGSDSLTTKSDEMFVLVSRSIFCNATDPNKDSSIELLKTFCFV